MKTELSCRTTPGVIARRLLIPRTGIEAMSSLVLMRTTFVAFLLTRGRSAMISTAFSVTASVDRAKSAVVVRSLFTLIFDTCIAE
jgi:hypothetical protein